jgi:hypothetical protein
VKHLDYINMMGVPTMSKEEGEKIVKAIRSMLEHKQGRAAIAIELTRACEENGEIHPSTRRYHPDGLSELDQVTLSLLKPDTSDLVFRIIKNRKGRRGFVSFKELPSGETDSETDEAES